MRTISMRKIGTNKVIDCPWKRTTFEPVPNCTDCNYVSKIDYAANEVKCKFDPGYGRVHRCMNGEEFIISSESF